MTEYSFNNSESLNRILSLFSSKNILVISIYKQLFEDNRSYDYLDWKALRTVHIYDANFVDILNVFMIITACEIGRASQIIYKHYEWKHRI